MHPKMDHRPHFAVKGRKTGPPLPCQPRSGRQAGRAANRTEHQRPIAEATHCGHDGNGNFRQDTYGHADNQI
jgi:hypothetical protein